jgi:NADPH-dependent 2,4-dienoyl-CoA reductase/sulfur reductase-like enzyme
MAERLVVIGGDAAGMSAAMQARRRQPYLDIVAIEKGPWTSYSACGIPYLIGGEVGRLEQLVARTPQTFREQHRIDVRLQHEVVGIDLAAGQLEVRDHPRERTITVSFDMLHLAMGARPVRPPLPGIDGDHVKGVQTLDDARVLLERVRLSSPARVVVVGGGYIGLEMAEAFVRRGSAVTLVEADEQLMRTLDRDMADRLLVPMRNLGIDVRLSTAVEAFEDGHVVAGGEELPADLVVLGLGVTPNSEIAAAAGVELGSRGSIKVDRRQQTSAASVWAAGDCAETFHLVSNRPIHVALGTVANKQGRVAGINIGGGYASFPGVVGTAITKVCQYEVARTGLTELEARRDGFEHVAATIETTTRAGYLPDARPMWVKMVAERGTGRLLGAQIVGEEGAAKRIDALAMALHARMDVQAVVDADLAYAPPFSSVWDPVQIAARKISESL